MTKNRLPNEQVRITTTVDLQTYKTLTTLAGRRTIIEGRSVALAEYVRRLLNNAVLYDKSALDDTELENRLSGLTSIQK